MPYTKKSGGTKKHGRNAEKCKKYKAAQKREKSHINKIRKHLRGHPEDKQARGALEAWEARLK